MKIKDLLTLRDKTVIRGKDLYLKIPPSLERYVKHDCRVICQEKDRCSFITFLGYAEDFDNMAAAVERFCRYSEYIDEQVIREKNKQAINHIDREWVDKWESQT